MRLQALTNRNNLALGQNPKLAEQVLRPGEYQAAQKGPGVSRMFYGHAVERLVAGDIQRSWIDKAMFRYVSGPSQPDFVGKGILSGANYDITTPGQISVHLARPIYGEGLLIATYERPADFLRFP